MQALWARFERLLPTIINCKCGVQLELNESKIMLDPNENYKKIRKRFMYHHLRIMLLIASYAK
jgi:hypothetical protein